MAVENIQPFGDLTEEEYEALKASIAEHGLLSPITKDQNGTVLDGNHRLRACRELGIQPRYELVVCETDDDRYVRALVMNLLRRHLTREQKSEKVSELRGRGWTFERIADETGIPVKTAHDLITDSDTNCEPANGATRGDQPMHIVTKTGAIRPASYNRKPKPQPAIVQAKNDREADRAEQALATIGDIAPARTIDVKRAERIAREKTAEERRAQPTEQRTVTDDAAIDIRHGDFREVLADIPDWSVDAIITDPPYPKDYIPLFGDLAELAARILKPRGVLVVMCGQFWLREYMAELDKHLRYRWTAAYIAQGPRTRVHAAGVATGWKPLLVYQGPDAFGQPFITDDLFDSAGDDKRHHHWGQSETGIAEQVERLTQPGALIVDPFLGGGTTAVVCRDLGRRFIGCDLDAAHVTTSRERLA